MDEIEDENSFRVDLNKLFEIPDINNFDFSVLFDVNENEPVDIPDNQFGNINEFMYFDIFDESVNERRTGIFIFFFFNFFINLILSFTIEVSSKEDIDFYNKLFDIDSCDNENGNVSSTATATEHIQTGGGGSFEFYTIFKESVIKNDKFGISQHTFILKLKPISTSFEKSEKYLSDMFNDIHSKLISTAGEKDRIKVKIWHEEFNTPINIPLMNRNDLSVDMIIEQFDNVSQSYKQVPSEEMASSRKFSMTVTIVKDEVGGAPLPYFRNWETFCYNKKRLVKQFSVDDNYCLVRAILFGKAIADKKAGLISSEQFKQYSRIPMTKLNKDVRQVVQKLKLSNEMMGYLEYQKLQLHFKDYQIMVFRGSGFKDDDPIFLDKSGEYKKFIYISLTNHHFNVIHSMARVHNKSYFCDYCKKAFNQLGHHVCENMCKSCKRPNCHASLFQDLHRRAKKFKCPFCSIQCNSETCRDQHIFQFCFEKNQCKKCFKHLKKNSKEEHICSETMWHCSSCKIMVDVGHECYIQTQDEIDNLNAAKIPQKFNGYIFFDYECYTEQGRHIPNLIMAQKVCSDCVDIQNPALWCDQDQKKYIFYTNEQFNNWLFNQDHYIALAHNLKVCFFFFFN
jgi:hypothetical protein